MDTFSASKLISARIGEFSKELPTPEEIDSFYSIENVEKHADRPYSWSNTISSLDGVVSVGQNNQGVKLVGLKTYPQAQAKTDFRLLAAGWAYADVIVFSAASLRAEPEQQLLNPVRDLIRFRLEVLKKKNEQPDIVVVTATGWLDTKHPAWKTNRRKLVATSRFGLLALMKSLKQQLETSENGTTDSVTQWLHDNQIIVKSFESTPDSDVDLVALVKFLKSEWNAEYLDVSAGPTLISHMIKAKVLDECRYTSSGLIAGRNPTGGEGIILPDERPETYPASINDYPIDKAPVLEFVGIRLFGPFHVYHRGKWLYRH